jgi:hypothetical protein
MDQQLTNFLDNITPEQIESHYKACLDSVNLINGAKPMYYTDADWQNVVDRNKEHLRIMLAKTFWTTQDLTPLKNASV